MVLAEKNILWKPVQCGTGVDYVVVYIKVLRSGVECSVMYCIVCQYTVRVVQCSVVQCSVVQRAVVHTYRGTYVPWIGTTLQRRVADKCFIRSLYKKWLFILNYIPNKFIPQYIPKFIHINTSRGYNIFTYSQRSALFSTYFVCLAKLPRNFITSCLLYLALVLHLNHEQLFKNSSYTNCSYWRRCWQVYVYLLELPWL